MKAYTPSQKVVDNPAGQDIIKEKTISAPIEQRGSAVGNPNAINSYGVGLNKRQTKLLNSLPSINSRTIVAKNAVNMKDLAALTAVTGHEYVMFTKGKERLIIRGDQMRVYVYFDEADALARSGYRWSGHTHVGIDQNVLEASPGDKAVLAYFDQEFSAIYNSKGQYRLFERE